MPKTFSPTSAYVLVVLTLLCSFSGDGAYARPAHLCDQAARLAADEFDVPLSILRAITRTETGRTLNGKLEPWPWAVNVAGQGHWFETKAEAISHVQNRVKAGLTNVDIGCFQLNYRWHRQAFSSTLEMFDPSRNARYAARFLSRLYDEKGDWMRAVGAYHSRTDEHAVRYKRRFSEIHQDLNDGARSETHATTAMPRTNGFPLLQPSTVKPRRGSLVPLSNTPSRGSLFVQNGET